MWNCESQLHRAGVFNVCCWSRVNWEESTSFVALYAWMTAGVPRNYLPRQDKCISWSLRPACGGAVGAVMHGVEWECGGGGNMLALILQIFQLSRLTCLRLFALCFPFIPSWVFLFCFFSVIEEEVGRNMYCFVIYYLLSLHSPLRWKCPSFLPSILSSVSLELRDGILCSRWCKDVKTHRRVDLGAVLECS